MTDIFNTDSVVPQQDQSTDPTATLLKEILNERGEQKYADVPNALKGLANAQEHIKTLQQQIEASKSDYEALKAELAKRQSVEEALAKLTSQPTQEPPPSATPQAGLTEQDVGALLERFLSERTQADMANANMNSVQQELVKVYGDKTKEVVAQRAQELGITSEDIGLLAQKSPKAALGLFTLTQQSQVPPKTSNILSGTMLTQTPSDTLAPPSKSLLSGASSKDVAEYMRQVKEYVYKKHGVQP